VSRAFTKETDGQELDELPERVVSTHRNLVTARGLAQIENKLRELRLAASDARAGDDRAELARLERDIRYWSQRLASAELVPPPEDTQAVRFGSKITLLDDKGHERRYRIVGEDEAEPREGFISYVSPLAQSLIGCGVGDAASISGHEFEIVAIHQPAAENP
jgi:transcription elongation GreA/GreB family factor